jgi:hypothetical protein
MHRILVRIDQTYVCASWTKWEADNCVTNHEHGVHTHAQFGNEMKMDMYLVDSEKNSKFINWHLACLQFACEFWSRMSTFSIHNGIDVSVDRRGIRLACLSL